MWNRREAAENIVTYRSENGPFEDRKTIEKSASQGKSIPTRR
jgi:transcriptional accessory protein Tex/SPT6